MLILRTGKEKRGLAFFRISLVLIGNVHPEKNCDHRYCQSNWFHEFHALHVDIYGNLTDIGSYVYTVS
jgi:hypothetical protein